jgi:hypothetical protein
MMKLRTARHSIWIPALVLAAGSSVVAAEPSGPPVNFGALPACSAASQSNGLHWLRGGNPFRNGGGGAYGSIFFGGDGLTEVRGNSRAQDELVGGPAATGGTGGGDTTAALVTAPASGNAAGTPAAVAATAAPPTGAVAAAAANEAGADSSAALVGGLAPNFALQTPTAAAVTPEPMSLLLLGGGAGAVGLLTRRRSKRERKA